MIETGINGLKIKVNKVVKDDKGILCELSKGENDEFLKSGIKNIYISIATGKHVPRAGHYHYKNIENFFTISGTALWYFKDSRKESPTYGREFKIILGFRGSNEISSKKIDTITIDKFEMGQIVVPAGVFHIFWPLSNEHVVVLAIASEPYAKDDYWRADEKEMERLGKILKEVVK